ncbi:hypothetical protein EYF80_055598 [Liparis tanakae]|uniref:Secreted protein n=1 Tax=Liparis tanakae TaxID=230148 RepID=A0A4Z2F0R8_9TELE|nr:hypothetical protein EYF80_055598 [Liparis tanakae]
MPNAARRRSFFCWLAAARAWVSVALRERGGDGHQRYFFILRNKRTHLTRLSWQTARNHDKDTDLCLWCSFSEDLASSLVVKYKQLIYSRGSVRGGGGRLLLLLQHHTEAVHLLLDLLGRIPAHTEEEEDYITSTIIIFLFVAGRLSGTRAHPCSSIMSCSSAHLTSSCLLRWCSRMSALGCLLSWLSSLSRSLSSRSPPRSSRGRFTRRLDRLRCT